MIETAEEVIVACDSGKFGRAAFAQIASLDIVDRVVTDAGVTNHWREMFGREGIELTVA